MKAELEIALTALTIEEKTDEDISPDLLAELDMRLTLHRKDTSSAITLEQFKRRQFNVK